MKIAASSSQATGNFRSIHRFLPFISLVLLVLSRTVFHQTRYQESLFGLGLGVLFAATLVSVWPGVFRPKEPETSDLQTLDLSR